MQGVIPQTAPFMVWRDKVDMEWEDEMKDHHERGMGKKSWYSFYFFWLLY